MGTVDLAEPADAEPDFPTPVKRSMEDSLASISQESELTAEEEAGGGGWGGWAGTASSWGSWAAEKTKKAASKSLTTAVAVTSAAAEVANAVADEQRKRVRGEVLAREGEELEAESISIHNKLVRHEEMRECASLVFESAVQAATTPSGYSEIDSTDDAAEIISAMINPLTPGYHIGVARTESNKVVGVLGATVRDAGTAGIGPFAVNPPADAGGLGAAQQLISDALEHCKECANVHVIQDQPLGIELFSTFGFRIAEPLAVVAGCPVCEASSGLSVRPMEPGDLEACARLAVQACQVDRSSSIQMALEGPTAGDCLVVHTPEGQLVAYTTSLATFEGHTVASTMEAMQALMQAAAKEGNAELIMLVPVRVQTELFEHCLKSGMRTIKMCTWMTKGGPVGYGSPVVYLPALYNP